MLWLIHNRFDISGISNNSLLLNLSNTAMRLLFQSQSDWPQLLSVESIRAFTSHTKVTNRRAITSSPSPLKCFSELSSQFLYSPYQSGTLPDLSFKGTVNI